MPFQLLSADCRGDLCVPLLLWAGVSLGYLGSGYLEDGAAQD